MPEPTDPPPAADVVDVRPVRLTRVCRVLAVLLVLVFTVVGVTLNVGSAQVFGVADAVAMIVLGLMLAAIVLGFTRARVRADASGLRIRGALGEKVVPWGVVAAVRLDDSQPWASLDLQDDDTLALFAVQANDGERATEAVLALRRLLHAAHGR